jgi:small-conductance mechanosensitive channel
MKDNSQRIGITIIKKSFLPVCILLVFMGLYVSYRLNIQPYLDERVKNEAGKYLTTIFIVCACFIVQRVTGAILTWYKDTVASKTVTRLDDELIPLLRRVFNVLIWVTAILIILPLYGINVNGLIATLGVSSLAIALAAQDTIANIIAGFMIMVDRPFRPGDRIKIPSGEVVSVLDVGVRRSKFLSDDKAVIIVPNLELSKSKIVNYTYGEERLKNGTQGGNI